jgi:hypothetical protein
MFTGLRQAAPALGAVCAAERGRGRRAQDLGSQRAAERFLERAQNKHGFGLIAVSLGYAETLLSVSGASTSSELSPAERAAAGARRACRRQAVAAVAAPESPRTAAQSFQA